jgi:hypothetical protein
MSDYSIEEKDSPLGLKYAVYKWDTYPEYSVLAGQARKSFVNWYDTEAEALTNYPGADIGYRSAHNTYSHLPGENDPVPGGMYPDDIDDGY